MELDIIESIANYHIFYYDTLQEECINISVINPTVVKALFRVEGKSDKGDAMTLARWAANFDLKISPARYPPIRGKTVLQMDW